MYSEFQNSECRKWSGFCNEYSNWIGKNNYGVILPLALEVRFHWNQWNYMHGSKMECWFIFTCQIKSAHKLVVTCARRAILKYVIRSSCFCKNY